MVHFEGQKRDINSSVTNDLSVHLGEQEEPGEYSNRTSFSPKFVFLVIPFNDSSRRDESSLGELEEISGTDPPVLMDFTEHRGWWLDCHYKIRE